MNSCITVRLGKNSLWNCLSLIPNVSLIYEILNYFYYFYLCFAGSEPKTFVSKKRKLDKPHPDLVKEAINDEPNNTDSQVRNLLVLYLYETKLITCSLDRVC